MAQKFAILFFPMYRRPSRAADKSFLSAFALHVVHHTKVTGTDHLAVGGGGGGGAGGEGPVR